MKKKIFLAVFLCCGMFAAMAQTAADSLAIVSADWQTEPLQKGMLYKKAVFSSLYGVPQEVSIFEISPKRYRFDVLVHNPKEETSIAARHAGAVAAINGSYFDMKAGNSVCYLRKDGVVIDTTSTGVLATVSNGAVLIKKGRLELIPWSKQEEKACTLKKGTVLASGPLMLKDGQVCDLSGTNRNFVNTKHPRSAVALTNPAYCRCRTSEGKSGRYQYTRACPYDSYIGRGGCVESGRRRFFYAVEWGVAG